MARLDHRLAKLEAEAERLPIVFKVVWDDDDTEPTAGRVIRLRWGDDYAPLRETPQTP
jgi:hypothetical protein